MNSRVVWTEDDSRAADRERISAAWLRLFGEPLPKSPAGHVLAEFDGEDTFYYLMPRGRIFVSAFDGGQIREVIA